MSLVRSRNLLHINAPKTFTTFDEVSGTNVLRWKNPNGFSASWAVQVGEVGGEQTEVMLLGVSAPSGTAGTLTASTLYEHPANTPIYGIKYDQVVFEKSASGTTGTGTAITDGTVTYQADHEHSIFDDTGAASTDAYRAFYRNSVTGGTTSESDWQTPAGFSFYSLASMRQRIKDKLWDSDYIKEDITLDNWINEWKDEMVTAAISTNEDYSMGTVDIGFGTAGLGTVTTADFDQIRRFEVTYNGNDFYLSTKKTSNDFLPNQTFLSTHPYHNWLGDAVFQVRPPESGGTARISFYRFGTIMVNDTDVLPLPLRPYTKSFVDYGLAQAFLKDNRSNEYEKLMIVSNAAREVFLNQITNRDKSSGQTIDLVEAISAEDDFWP